MSMEHNNHGRTMYDDTMVLYHKDCNDGIGAAYVAITHGIDSKNVIAWQYDDDFPHVSDSIKHLIMLDLSPTEEQLMFLSQMFQSVLVIDHHKSTRRIVDCVEMIDSLEEYLKRREQVQHEAFLLFDEDRSGVALAWAFFTFSRVPVPKAVLWLEDYDLWRFRYDVTTAVNAWLASNRTMEQVKILFEADSQEQNNIITSGQLILQYNRVMARQLAAYPTLMVSRDGVCFGLINGPYHLRNDIASVLLQNDEVDVAVVYQITRDAVVFSLRSTEIDVADIAQSFGGGGHATAAGFSILATESKTIDSIIELFK